jgi:hypothetical protein
MTEQKIKRMRFTPTDRHYQVSVLHPKGVVFSFFDLSGVLAKPWADAGYECHIIDIQHGQAMHTEGNITKWGMDVYEWEKMFAEKFPDKLKNAVFAAFFPPCTDLAVSGARWFEKKEHENPGTRKRAMDLIYWSNTMGKKLRCPYFIENPVSVVSSEWRCPDFWFHPYEYGGYRGGSDDGYTKKTCLWTGGGFDLPIPKPIKLDPRTCDRIHKMPPSADRQNMRSKTPTGFATAIFEHYSKTV